MTTDWASFQSRLCFCCITKPLLQSYSCSSMSTLIAGQASAQRRPPTGPYDVFKEDGPTAKAFCASPAFRSLSCGWASEDELRATTRSQNPFSGTAFNSLPADSKLPADVDGGDGSLSRTDLRVSCRMQLRLPTESTCIPVTFVAWDLKMRSSQPVTNIMEHTDHKLQDAVVNR